MDFQDQDKQQEQGKNPFNANVLKGGQVDPRSKLYQRSIAGREKLSDMLQRLWDQGADEADVFMAGVKALTSRDKGYVGAYLDSKNPERRYQDNEAKAITDQVMSDLGIGEHPGARLTRPKDGEGKEERKTSNQMRGAFGPGRPGGEAPRKAMPVGQQRKQGKRSSTGQPLEGSTRPSQEEERQKRQEGKQDYYYPKTDVQREYMDIMKDGVKDIQSRVDSGQITAEQAVVETSKLKDRAMAQAGREANEVRRYKGDLTPKEQEQADKKKQRQDEMRQRIAEQKGLRDQEAAAGPEPEEEFKPTVDGGKIREAFKEHYKNALKRNKLDLKSHVKRVATTEAFSTDLADIIYSIEEEGFKVDPGEFKKAVARSFGINVDNYPGWDSEIKSGAAQEPSSPEAPAPSAAPTETAAAPEPAEGAAPETEEAPTAAPEAPKEEEEAPAPAPEPEAPAAGPSEEKAPKPAQSKRTRAETQEIQKRGSEELAKTQETNRKLEAMTKRMANSPLVKNEEMRNWINNDLDRLLKSFTPAEKTEDPWEQDGPEATGIPKPAAQSPASQKALAGQPGPRGLLSPGKEPQAPPPASGRRTKAQGDEIRRRGQETLEQLQKGAATGRRMANSPVAKREDEINRRGEEALREIQNPPSPKKGRRTKAEGDEIRRRGQEALEQIQGEARRGREVQSRMANSPAATGEAPSTGREADITRRGEEALRGEVYGNIKDRPGMTNREANRILREGGYTQPRRGLDAAARAVTEGMDRHDAVVNKLPKRVRKSVPKFNSAEYQEFAQSIRSMMR